MKTLYPATVDVLYLERANGAIEAFTYSDGRRVHMWQTFRSMVQGRAWAERNGWSVVEVTS